VKFFLPQNRTFALVARYSIMAVVTLLIVEFLLGMWINIYAALPIGTKLTLSQQPDFAGKGEVGIHLIVGVLLGIVSIVTLIFTALLKKVIPSVVAVVGVVSIVVAGFAGLGLSNGGYNENGASFVMSVAFLVAILIYLNLGRMVGFPRKQSAVEPNSYQPSAKT
jgi:hypothetical protein